MRHFRSCDRSALPRTWTSTTGTRGDDPNFHRSLLVYFAWLTAGFVIFSVTMIFFRLRKLGVAT